MMWRDLFQNIKVKINIQQIYQNTYFRTVDATPYKQIHSERRKCIKPMEVCEPLLLDKKRHKSHQLLCIW
jgi:hypothetical protein